jgi:hypothetical protein
MQHQRVRVVTTLLLRGQNATEVGQYCIANVKQTLRFCSFLTLPLYNSCYTVTAYRDRLYSSRVCAFLSAPSISHVSNSFPTANGIFNFNSYHEQSLFYVFSFKSHIVTLLFLFFLLFIFLSFLMMFRIFPQYNLLVMEKLVLYVHRKQIYPIKYIKIFQSFFTRLKNTFKQSIILLNDK